VDEAASRIRQEVDEEANIIVGAIIEPALEQRRASISRPIVGWTLSPSPNRFSPETLHGLRWTRPRKRPSALPNARLRLFQRPSSHFQSRRGGVRL
jgi:hypothetical protein